MENEYREPAAVKLLERLEDLAYSDKVAFGQQNAAHIGISINAKDGTESDISNLCGKMPAVVGIDTLSFWGYEGNFADMVKVVKNLSKKNIIVTLSSHMPNFSLGEYYGGYTPNFTEGDVGSRILPGGDLNARYVKFLDKIAEFCKSCVDLSGECIPMIFRPFHEDNGDWFWWGAAHLADDKFIELFRYTIDYLRIDCNVRSLLFSYSPNGGFRTPEEYMRRYPGDDYIDVLGLDLYDDYPKKNNGFWDKLTKSLAIVNECAMDHGKVMALTEVGPRVLDMIKGKYYEGLAPKNNPEPQWFSRLLEAYLGSDDFRRAAYILIWANFSETQFWGPYKIDDFRHEMCDDYLKFLNDDRIILSGDSL